MKPQLSPAALIAAVVVLVIIVFAFTRLRGGAGIGTENKAPATPPDVAARLQQMRVPNPSGSR